MALKLVRMLLIVIATTPFLLAQDNAPQRVGISVVAGNEVSSPVRIVSVKRDFANDITGVTLENTSEKTVIAVRFNLHLVALEGCSSERPIVMTNSSNSDVPEELWRIKGLHLRPVLIRPHERVSTVTSLIGSDLLVWARMLETHYLHTELALAFVKFADGTMWHSAYRVSPELLKADEVRCREFGGYPKPIPNTIQIAAARDSAHFQAAADQRGYMFVCLRCAGRGGEVSD
jgi:hypothetical protein